MKSLLSHFELAARAPGGIEALRKYILELAVRGKLVPQDRHDEPASELLKRITAEKARLVKEGKIKAGKELPPIGEEEKPFKLPDGWEWCRLGEITIKLSSGSTPLGGKQVYQSDGPLFLRSQNVWNTGLELSGVAHISKDTHQNMGNTHVSPHDLLFNITGASIGRCAMVPDEFPEANVSQHVVIVRPALKQYRFFLHVVLISDHIQNMVQDVQVGVSREGLSVAKLQNFAIPLPPLPEQARIVARVEELMAVLDSLEAKAAEAESLRSRSLGASAVALSGATGPTERKVAWARMASSFDSLAQRPEDVKALRATILELAVRGALVPQDKDDEPASELLKRIAMENVRLVKEGKIKAGKELPPVAEEEKPFKLPAGWEWVQLKEVSSQITKGSTPTTYGFKYEEKGVNFLKVENIEKNHVIKESIKQFISQEAHGYFKRSQLEAGDVLFSIAGTIGEICKITSAILPANINQALAIIRGTDEYFVQDYLILCLNSKISEQVNGRARGGAMNNVSLGDLQEMHIPLPPFPEQARIVARVEELMAACDRLEAALAAKETAAKDFARAATVL